MAPFPFLQRESLSELARQVSLTGYVPNLELTGLLPGIDNVRHDVFLSPTFIDVARQHVHRLIARYGNVEDLLRRTRCNLRADRAAHFSLGSRARGRLCPAAQARRRSCRLQALRSPT